MESSSGKSLARCLVVMVITAGMMFAAPVAAQSWFDRFEDTVGLGEESGEKSDELLQSTLVERLKEALRLGSERFVARPRGRLHWKRYSAVNKPNP